MNYLQDFFGFAGRLSKKEYLKRLVVLYMLMIFTTLDGWFPVAALQPWPLFLLYNPLILIFAFMKLSLVVRRFHDRGKPFWWTALLFIAPEAFYSISFMPLQSGYVLSSLVIWFLLETWCFVETLILRGQVGENLYGPNPANLFPDEE